MTKPGLTCQPKLTTKRGRRRVTASLAESKTLKLYQEARRLLAKSDFDVVSVTEIADAAAISVGAFYVRFADKDAFLDFLTAHTFASARRGFDRSLSSIASHNKPAEALSEAIISQFAAKEFAGIVRLAVKRGLSSTERRRDFDAYRTHLADQVVSLLPCDTPSEDKTETELAIQSAFGILTDAISSTSRAEPLKLSSYHDTVVQLLSKSFEKLKLEKPKTTEVAEQPGVKKI